MRNQDQRPGKDTPSGDETGNMEGDSRLSFLQDSLRTMVAGESRLVRQGHLTDQIIRAVRPSESRIANFDDLWSGFLVSWFRPVMVVGMLLIVLLAVYNASREHPGVVERTTTERVLGLHSVSVVSLYDSDLASISR